MAGGHSQKCCAFLTPLEDGKIRNESIWTGLLCFNSILLSSFWVCCLFIAVINYPWIAFMVFLQVPPSLQLIGDLHQGSGNPKSLLLLGVVFQAMLRTWRRRIGSTISNSALLCVLLGKCCLHSVSFLYSSQCSPDGFSRFYWKRKGTRKAEMLDLLIYSHSVRRSLEEHRWLLWFYQDLTGNFLSIPKQIRTLKYQCTSIHKTTENNSRTFPDPSAKAFFS